AEARQNLTAAVEEHSQAMVQASRTLAAESGVSFGGIDFSVAPYPEQARSVGTAMEQLGVPAVGLPGSLAAAALITSSLDRAKFARIGFSGLMLPLMEDSTLAARAAQGVLSVTDLMLYSAVCGVGLDTLPLPGDITPQQLYGILLDLATLSKRLDKPLTARLMPIPGKRAGDQTDFDFEYFVNSRVLALPSDPVGGLLAGDETLEFGL
ncbi:MAG: DUF711 family protein, partial [Planctomycetales bacterium]|nr:DUF711 family protein [Planctomycetales bacterium]NIM08945.1 DUF711 family protein [Planctomycetales bacterium]NIN08411.1 DUF711 family protein [Planctomycetales bacterium]NIN76263.1 DUF711 family protein [Planctomycetales bacterium]NIP04589.1 DUF711 family protein [Planctomycetales bacterium]